MLTLLRFVVLLMTVAISAIAPPAMAQNQSGPSVVDPSLPQGPPSGGKAPEQRSSVTFKDGRLSINAQNRSLERVVDQITQKAGIAVILGDGLGKQPINLSFQNLPLDEGLRQILKDYDAFFFYGVGKEGPASLSAIWVYPRGRGRGLEPVPPEKWASTAELEKLLADPDPQVRLRAVHTLIDRKGNNAEDMVLGALKDADGQVRAEALYTALRKGVELPADSLINLALGDPSPDVRVLALDAIARGPDARPIAVGALNDPNPHVQDKAREIIEALDSAEGQPEPTQTPQGQPAPQN